VSYVVIVPVALIFLIANPMTNFPAAVTIAIISFIAGVVLLSMIARRLKIPFDKAPVSAEDENTDEQLGLVLDRSRFPGKILSPPSSGKPLDEKENPVYIKELRYELFGRGTLLVRLLLQVSLVAALPFFIIAAHINGLWVYSFYMLVFVMLIAPSFSAGIFTQERERATFDLLLTTPLTKHQIISAKLRATLRNIGILAGFLTPPLLLYLAIRIIFASEGKENNHVSDVAILGFCTCFILAATIIFVIALSSFFSLICRTTMRSMIFSYLVAGSLFFLPLLVYQVLERFAGVPISQAHWFGVTSPFFSLASLEPGSFTAHGFHIPADIAAYHLVIYGAITLTSSLALIAAIYMLYGRYCQLRHDIGM
ncbi:MAG: ABC transporter permease subunit, partial [Planctomycetes bacterium]|nr:ABC transporter permease subunit [Planctomycetota bacterium]